MPMPYPGPLCGHCDVNTSVVWQWGAGGGEGEQGAAGAGGSRAREGHRKSTACRQHPSCHMRNPSGPAVHFCRISAAGSSTGPLVASAAAELDPRRLLIAMTNPMQPALLHD